MSVSLKVGKTAVALWRHQLNTDFFKYDIAFTVLRFVIGVAIIVFALVRVWVDWPYILSIDNWLMPEWLAIFVMWLLLGRLWISSSEKSSVHSEGYADPFLSDKNRQTIDVFHSLNYGLKRTLRRAYTIALRNGTVVDGVSITQAILQDKSIIPLLVRLGVNKIELQGKLSNARKLDQLQSLINIDVLMPAAYAVAFSVKARSVGVGEMLAVLVEHDAVVREVFLDVNIDSKMIKNVLSWIHYDETLRLHLRFLKWRSLVHPKHHMDRAMTAVETPLLNQLGVDMTERAAVGWYLPAVEREDVLKMVFEIIANNNSPLIVGEPGVGKQRFIQLLAQHMVTKDVPNIIQEKRLVSVSVGQLISGADMAGVAARIQRLFYEAMTAGNVVLVLEDIDGLSGIRAGQGESVDVASVVASAIEQSGVMVIATTHPEAYRAVLFGTQVGELLKRVDMSEPDTELAIRMVQTRAHVAEARHQVYFTYSAIERLVKLTQRYVHDRFLPRKATEHLDRIALEVYESKGELSVINVADVDKYLEHQLHLPLQQTGTDESELLLNLEEVLHTEIIGQDRAVSTVSAALRRTRSGMRNDQRPIAVLLFLGPTGVGKTALAKSLAKIYFKNGENMLRLDMTEYQGEDGVAKMLGARGQSSAVVSSLREKPFQVVLLDEFEKAGQSVKNLFLQVFDDARLSDGQGKTADFTNTIIIATSNAGADIIQQATANNMTDDDLDKLISEEVLKKNFSPELLNRFDDVVIFHPLTLESVKEITRLAVNSIETRLADKGIGLSVSDVAVESVAKAGYDRRFGARPLRRAVQRLLEEPIANMLLRGQVNRRDMIVVNSLDNISVKKGAQL